MGLGFCDITIDLLKKNNCNLSNYTAEDVLKISKMVKVLYSLNICSNKKMCEIVEGVIKDNKYRMVYKEIGVDVEVSKIRYNSTDNTILIVLDDAVQLYLKSEFNSPLEVLFEVIKRVEFELNRRFA